MAGMLNDLYKAFDEVVEAHDAYKVSQSSLPASHDASNFLSFFSRWNGIIVHVNGNCDDVITLCDAIHTAYNKIHTVYDVVYTVWCNSRCGDVIHVVCDVIHTVWDVIHPVCDVIHIVCDVIHTVLM